MADPHTEIASVLDWLGEGELEPAVAAVRRDLRTFERPEEAPPDGVDAEMVAVFDDVMTALEQEGTLGPTLIRRMNEVQGQLRERFT